MPKVKLYVNQFLNADSFKNITNLIKFTYMVKEFKKKVTLMNIRC